MSEISDVIDKLKELESLKGKLTRYDFYFIFSKEYLEPYEIAYKYITSRGIPRHIIVNYIKSKMEFHEDILDEMLQNERVQSRNRSKF